MLPDFLHAGIFYFKIFGGQTKMEAHPGSRKIQPHQGLFVFLPVQNFLGRNCISNIWPI
jgi:hypothetical protein